MLGVTEFAHLGTEIALISLSLALSTAIGLERRHRNKSAGVRTHTLVGLGATVFTLVSAYGFADVLSTNVAMDPSRITAQIVSGVGFLGAGLIFVRRDRDVSGLTTAASIWVTAAIGTACGAGLPFLAVIATCAHLFSVLILGRLGRTGRRSSSWMLLRYHPGGGTLPQILDDANALRVVVMVEDLRRVERTRKGPVIEARLALRGRRSAIERLVETVHEQVPLERLRIVNDAPE